MASRCVFIPILIGITYLYAIVHAQDPSSCSAFAPHLSPNASSDRSIPALRVEYLGSENEPIIKDDIDIEWHLSSSIQPVSRMSNDSSYQGPDTQTVVWLDTGDTNTTRLGSQMRMCHNFIPLQNVNNITWSQSTLERSVGDTGNCSALVSEACLDRLKAQYQGQAMGQWSDYTGCRGSDTSVPWECRASGMPSPLTIANPAFDANLTARIPLLSNASAATIQESDELVCSGRNFSRSFGTMATIQDYDLATNFPLMDIMTFFPTEPMGRTYGTHMHRVQIVCLVPGQVAEGSRQKAKVEDVLGRYNSTGGNQTVQGWKAHGGTSIFGRNVGTWALVAWVVGVGFASAV